MMKNEFLTAAAEKIQEVKLLLEANRFHAELEQGTPLDQILARELPATDGEKLNADVEKIYLGVDSVYSNLDDVMDKGSTVAHLNNALSAYTCNEQAAYLMNLVSICEAQPSDPRWQMLKQQTSYTEEDVKALVDIVLDALEGRAGYLARQEFLVMEHALKELPPEKIQVQMGSGKLYSEAYAAALYIRSRQENMNIDAYDFGLRAATAVEASSLLAKYHYGKLYFDEAMPKLKALMKWFLIQAGTMAVGLAKGALAALVISCLTDISILIVLPLTVVLAVVYTSQEEALQTLQDIWENVKFLVGKVTEGVTNIYHKVSEYVKTAAGTQTENA